MLYKKSVFAYVGLFFRLGLSILNIALNQAVLPQHILNRRRCPGLCRRRQVKQGKAVIQLTN